jgi:sugar/nucleoside kinase (ribokinase family)
VSLLVVGSVALDTVETPFGKVEEALGGSAVYISAAASYFSSPVRLVAVVGGDFPKKHIEFMESRQIDLDGLEIVESARTFRWGGKYHYDLNMRDTLFTELNAFKDFDPKIPDTFKNSAYVCLGNIDPELQLQVLNQIKKPRLIVGDTMNYWIETKMKELAKTMKSMDVLIVNDSEARLMTKGPRIVIIKKGEHGAMLITEETIFSAPAYPLETIFDPTGAGDSFAGGFIGWLARTEDLSTENLKRAVVYGSTLASFSVEKFSVDGLRDINYMKIQDRFHSFMELSRFDERT